MASRLIVLNISSHEAQRIHDGQGLLSVGWLEGR